MKNNYALRWIAVVIWMIVIFAFSHQAYSGRETERYLGDANVPVRKAGHVGEYMILYILVRTALSKPRNGIESGESPARSIIPSPSTWAFIISFAYAVTDEWHQSFVPGRSATWSDVAVDTSGIFLGVVISNVFRRFLSRLQ